MECTLNKSDAVECESDIVNDLPSGSVEATAGRGNDVKLHIAPIVAHDRKSLLAAIRNVKQQLNECLTELINEEKNCKDAECSKKKASADEDYGDEGDGDDDEGDEGVDILAQR
jgi:hypothetical protein